VRAVLLVDDAAFVPEDPCYSEAVWPKHVQTEYSVAAAVRSLGYEVVVVSVKGDIGWTVEQIRRASPDFVFNLVEEIGGFRQLDSLAVQLLELMQIPYTGASFEALSLTRNKHLAKLVVAEAGVLVPHGAIIRGDLKFSVNDVAFPAILKPANLDGSDGVTQRSYVKNATELRKRLPSFKKWVPLLCEQYIPGRELILTLSGSKQISVDSICEMVFPPTAPVQFATDRAKFDQGYRNRFGIEYRTPTYVEPALRKRVVELAKRAYKALAINAYAKLEFRIDQNRIVFIEANANSQLSRFAKSTDFRSIGYERFIKKIIRLAYTRTGQRV
jgi:D-alanine-D-alanine ligase